MTAADASPSQTMRVWDATISDQLPEFDWSTIWTDPTLQLSSLRALRDLGFVIVRNGPTDEDAIGQMAALVGPLVPSAYGLIWDLRPEHSDTVIGNTMEAVPPHTDEAYRHDPPGVRILYCVTPAETGGEVALVDGFAVTDRLRSEAPDTFALLSSIRQPFQRVIREDGIDQRTMARSIVVDDDGKVIGVRFQTASLGPMAGVVNDVELVQEANEVMRTITVDPALLMATRLEAGDAVLFDNHRVLHSRLAFADPARRHQISTMSRESLHQALRTTAFSLGLDDEAEQYLSAGVVG